MRKGLNLSEFIENVDRLGELRHVRGADWNLEIGAVTDLNAKRHGPALLFDEIKGYPKGYRVLTSLISSPKRLSLALGLNITGDHHRLVSELETKPTLWEEKSKEFPPRFVTDSPLLRNRDTAEKIDLLKFPAPVWHEADGGRYIGSGATVITKDPDRGTVNLGVYRIMVHSKDALGLFMVDWHHGALDIKKYHDRGKPCPIAVSFGHDPVLFVVSGMPIPYEISEYNYAGAIRGKPIDVIEGKETGLPIPATGEIVAEGFIYPNDLMEEGPFGEFTGYYAEERAPRPVIRVKSVYYKDNPIILATPPGRPPHDYSYHMAVMASAALKTDLEKSGVPGVVKVWRHESGCRYFWIVVSIHQMYAGHVKQTGLVAASQRGFGRYVIIVDDDIDPSNLDEVIWAMSTRSDPVESAEIVKQTPSSSMDPRIRKHEGAYYTSRMIIDACRPFEWMKEYSRVVEVSDELKTRVKSKWPELFGNKS